MGLLTKMYLGCAPTQLPDKDGLMLMAAAWDEQLDAIPTDWLDRAFKAALKGHRSAFPLTTGEVLDAWDGLINVRQQAAASIDTRHLLPGAPKDTYYVQGMMAILKAFCEEHRDPLTLPTRLKYALTIVKDGGRAGNFRDLLESTGKDTLYAALTDLGIAVDPPPAPKPGTVGAWAKVGESF